MALTSKKKLMLEKQYLYVKASMGFQLEGMNVEKVWVNTGYYRFLVDNVAKALSNSYINIWYDPSDIDFIAYCSDLFMEEIQNTVVTAVENLETYLQQFAQQNHEDFEDVQETLDDLNTGLSGALQTIVSKLGLPFLNLNFDTPFFIDTTATYAYLKKKISSSSSRTVEEADFELNVPYVVLNNTDLMKRSELYKDFKITCGTANDKLVFIYPDGSVYRSTSNGVVICPLLIYFAYFWVVRVV